MPDTDVERRDDPAVSRALASLWRPDLAAGPVAASRIPHRPFGCRKWGRGVPAGLKPAPVSSPVGWMRALARALRRPELPDTWLQNVLSREGPEFEGVRLLGDAWRSPVATAVQLGRHVDLVEVPESVASPAWHHLRRQGMRCGAVFATGDRWSFLIPARLGHFPWPAEARHLTDCLMAIPARCARDRSHERWWVSRPASGPLTHPLMLVGALTTFAGSASSAPPRVTDPAGAPVVGLLSPPLCSPGV
ncbi:hypothetical protein [Streptomyces canus]|uniref:hypothetical protein n=1 Tax=Streptomyces canus TaxID=58343 RepID=UPI0036EDB545